jgi:hypothetical protein
MEVEMKPERSVGVHQSIQLLSTHLVHYMRPESKSESNHLIDIEEAPYLVGGDRMKTEAKRLIHRDRRRSARQIIQAQFAEYLYDS